MTCYVPIRYVKPSSRTPAHCTVQDPATLSTHARHPCSVIKFSRNAVPPPVFGVPPRETVVPPPGNVFMVHTVFFVQLIISKVINIVVIRCQILRLKRTEFDFGWRSTPDTAGGAYSAL